MRAGRGRKKTMGTQISTAIQEPVLYEANPHFSDEVNRNIIESEIEGGVYLRDLLPGSVLSIETKSRTYEMVILADGFALISGHPEFCPEPTEVHVEGSTWGGSMIKQAFLGRGMRLELRHPMGTMSTSRIIDIRVH